MREHVSKPELIINRLNVSLRFWLWRDLQSSYQQHRDTNLEHAWDNWLYHCDRWCHAYPSCRPRLILSLRLKWRWNYIAWFLLITSRCALECYSKIAEKEVCFQWKWNKKTHAGGKLWLNGLSKSIHLRLFCWIKSVEIFSLFLTHLRSFQVKPFQLIYSCSCIAR